MNKLCNVIMLPINDESNLFLSDDMLFISDNSYTKAINKIVTKRESFQHLYITSDEEIKEGDWCYDSDLKIIFQNSNRKSDEITFKIIATTDNSISLNLGKEFSTFPDGYEFHYTRLSPFPQIPQSFITLYIEEYNAGRKIEKVWVEYHHDYMGKCIPDEEGCHYYDNSLKINSDNTISIKPIKESWNREEVVELLEKFNDEKCIFPKNIMNNWIKENL